MFYPGMPDLYQYQGEGESYNTFWHEGEFYLHNRQWRAQGKSQHEEFQYFDTTDECLKAMLEIAPYKDWKRVDFE